MKKGNVLILAIAATALLGGSAWLYAKKTGGHEEKKTSLRIGVLLYRGDDTFIGTLRNSMEQAAKEYEKETGVRVTLDVRDAKRNQLTQNSQAERMIDLGCDVLCVNMVDRSAASGVIDQAMESDIPIVFFNREPVAEDMNRWEKLYYVGADAKESAVLEGQILVDAYRKNPSTLDRNRDGVVSYVLLEGETNHQDSLIRTEWSIETLKDGGVPIEKITGGIANWERNQASALMEQWLSDYGNKIELVTWLSVRAMPSSGRGSSPGRSSLSGSTGHRPVRRRSARESYSGRLSPARISTRRESSIRRRSSQWEKR